MWCVKYKWQGREYFEYVEVFDSVVARALVEGILIAAGVFDYQILSVKKVGKG